MQYFGGNNNKNNNNKNNNKNENRNGYGGMYEQRLVHFKLCPLNSCSSCDKGGDYVIDLVSDYPPNSSRKMLITDLI